MIYASRLRGLIFSALKVDNLSQPTCHVVWVCRLYSTDNVARQSPWHPFPRWQRLAQLFTSKKGIERSAARSFKFVLCHVMRNRVLLPQAHFPTASAYHSLSSPMVNFNDPTVIVNDICAHAC